MLIPSPTYVGPLGRSFDHTATVLAEAVRLTIYPCPAVPDPPIVIKTSPTTPLVRTDGWQERRRICEEEVLPALRVPDPRRVAGQRILVYDDVFTDGLLLDVLARRLVSRGALTVCRVTLARQLFTTAAP